MQTVTARMQEKGLQAPQGAPYSGASAPGASAPDFGARQSPLAAYPQGAYAATSPRRTTRFLRFHKGVQVIIRQNIFRYSAEQRQHFGQIH